MNRILLLICFLLIARNRLPAQTSQPFSDGGVFGEVSFTHGTNTGHSVMAFGPNAHMAFAGPNSIDPNFDFAMLAVEAHWIDGYGKTIEEFYFTTPGNFRVLWAGRNLTDGISGANVNGYFLVDGTQPGMHSYPGSPTVSIVDNRSNFASISVRNLNSTSTGAQLILGAGMYDTTGWSLQNDPAQNGAHTFAVLDRAIYGFPFQIDSAGRISLGFRSLHTATRPMEFADPKGVREGLNIYSKYKTADLDRTNAGASIDPDLSVTLEPGIWKVSADLFFQISGGTPGFWVYFDSSGGSISRGWSRWTFPDSTSGQSATTYNYNVLGSTTGAYQSIGPATGNAGYFVKGEAVVTVTSTTSLQLVWGQYSPQAQTTTLLAPSCLVATKIN